MTRRTAWFVGLGLVICLALAGIVSHYASASPDGLERVAAEQGFLETANGHRLEESPLAGYTWQGVGDPRLAGGLAGIAGVLVTLALAGALFAYLGRHRKTATDAATETAGDASP